MLELGERLPAAPLSFSLSLFAIMTDIDLILVLILLVFLVEGEDKLEPLSPFLLHKIIHR